MRVSTFLKGAAIGAVAAGVAVTAMLMTIDVNQYRGFIEQQVEAATGRKLSIKGPMDLAISLSPAVVIEDVAFANAPWAERPQMLTARRIEAQLQLLPLLQGQIQVDRLVLVGPDLALEVNRDGVGNWTLQAPGSAAAGEGASDTAEQGRAALPDLRLVRFEDATVTFTDHAAGTSRRLALAAFEAAADGWVAPLELAGSGKLDQAAFTLEGRLGPLASLMGEGGAPYPAALSLGVAGATLAVDGTLADPLAGTGLDLGVRLEAPEPAALVALAAPGAGSEDLPPLRLDGRVKDVKGGWRVDNLSASIGETSVAGSLAVTLDGPRPRLGGTLSSPRVDLAALMPAGTPGSGSGGAASAGGPVRLFSAEPLPLALLGLADADLDVAVQTLVLPDGAEVSAVAAKVQLANRRLKLAPLTAGLGGGTVSVVAMLDASGGKGAALALDVTSRDVALGPLLAQFGKGGAVQDGPLDAAVKVSGLGGSLHEIMDSLDGSMSLTVGAGTIDNEAIGSWTQDIALRLIDSLNPLQAKERYTVMQCGVVRLGVKNGVATAERGIALETPKFTISGSGTIDLGTETLDMAVKTAVREGTGIATANLANLVRVQGPITDPGIAIDPLGAARTAVSVGGAIATGGLSLLAETLIERTTGDESACAVALGKAAAAPAPASGAAAPAQSAPAPAPADPVQGLGNALKGLFGQ